MAILPVGIGASGPTQFQIERSLRFNSADSAYLNRTPASAGNQKTWTLSFWMKRSALGATTGVFYQSTAASDTGYFDIIFSSGDALVLEGWSSIWRVTSQVFRDTSALYHIVVAVDTTQATANNRIRLYVNGSEVTAFSTTVNPTQDSTTGVNGTGAAGIGRNNSTYFNGYLSDVYLIDGQALTPSSFGENDTDTGVWKPKAYTGTYGTNGFYLKFADNSGTTSTTLGKDSSGNGNNWTPNNFSVTAGAGNDSLVDTPTPYGTDTGAGGEVRGNYCTVNPLDKSSDVTLSNGNLDASCAAGSAWRAARSTVGISSGKWYWEVLCNNISGSTDRALLGIMKSGANLSSYVGSDASGWGYYSNDGNKYSNATAAAYGASYSTGDVIGIAFDADNGDLKFYKNGTVQNSGTAAYTGLTSGPYIPAISLWNGSVTVNFGQRPFAYTAPSGFKALCTTNLPTPAIGATSTTRADDYFNTVLYSGTGSAQSITGVGFQPSFFWVKPRNNANVHHLIDAVRGIKKHLFSNNTNAEETANTGTGFTSFDSDGFSLGTDTSTTGNVNLSGVNYVAWNWKGNGAGSSNTQGSITSTVSANTTSGFSIVTYLNASGTVGHGLGVAPKMIIYKDRDNGSNNWVVTHTSLATMSNDYLVLNTTGAAASGLGLSANPTSTVFSTSTALGGSGNKFVAYCFAEVAGYSRFGSYTGNGSADGPFIYTGFRPRFVIIKQTDTTGYNWNILDSARSPANVVDDYLSTNTSNAENAVGALAIVDFLSNGFKLRADGAFANGSGGTYIYMAFAENPFKYSLAR